MGKNGSLPKLFLLITALIVLHVPTASALTVNEVARELACPCECPLVLEDCNMSCGLDWKNQIGEQVKEGKTKEQIMEGFIAKYGDACRITPIQRIHGKFFQYTRAFDTREWVIFWSVIAVWTAALFVGLYLLVRRLLPKAPEREEG